MTRENPLKSVALALRALPRFLVDSIFRLMHVLEARSKIARKSRFDTAPRDGFVIADGPHGRYVLSPRDRFISRAIAAEGRFDFDKVELVFAALGRPATDLLLVDIGANIGSICIPLVREGRVGDAIAVEPEPLNYRLLTINVLFNGLEERIKTVRAALGESDGAQLILALSADNLGDHQVVSAGSEAARRRGTIIVPGLRLDTLLAPHAGRDLLLWIDVQGFEGAVLAGGPETLARRPPLVLEFWPEGQARTGGYERLKAALLAAGYTSVTDLLDEDAEPLVLTADRLDALYRHYETLGYGTDLLLR